MSGPVPNREADLARPRERKGADVQSVTKGTMKPTKVPNADRDWHPIARRFWDGLKTSGQAEFYQNSDWAYAFMLCENLSIYSQPRVNKETGEEYHKRSPEMLKALLSAMTNLLVTEGDRRRVRLELTEPEDDKPDAELIAIDGYKASLGMT